MGRARDVARAAGAGADFVDRFMHRRAHGRVLAHAEIVVGAPDGDLAAACMVVRVREIARFALEIGEHAVATFGFQPVDALLKKPFVIHRLRGSTRPAVNYRTKRLPCQSRNEAGCRGLVARYFGAMLVRLARRARWDAPSSRTWRFSTARAPSLIRARSRSKTSASRRWRRATARSIAAA